MTMFRACYESDFSRCFSKCSSLIVAVFEQSSNRSTNTSAMDNKADRIVWMDCVMTGLDEDKHTLVKITLIVTDAELNPVAMGPNIVIHQDEQTLSKMNDYSRQKFTANGLLVKIRASEVGMREAEEKVLAFLKGHVIEKVAQLAGNFVYHDRVFIKKCMPDVDAFFHEDFIDVDSIRLLALRWYPIRASEVPRRSLSHMEYDSVEETIGELKHYKDKVFQCLLDGDRQVPDLARCDSKKKKYDKSERLVWMKCKLIECKRKSFLYELTEKKVVEIGVIITNKRLNIIAEWRKVIHHDTETLSRMDESSKEIMERNGLMDEIRNSTVELEDADEDLRYHLKRHVFYDAAQLAGNTVYMDRLFIRKFMPLITGFLRQRVIDVNTIKELSRRWYPSAVASAPKKKINDRVLDDIKESIAELKHYKANVFR